MGGSASADAVDVGLGLTISDIVTIAINGGTPTIVAPGVIGQATDASVFSQSDDFVAFGVRATNSRAERTNAALDATSEVEDARLVFTDFDQPLQEIVNATLVDSETLCDLNSRFAVTGVTGLTIDGNPVALVPNSPQSFNIDVTSWFFNFTFAELTVTAETQTNVTATSASAVGLRLDFDILVEQDNQTVVDQPFGTIVLAQTECRVPTGGGETTTTSTTEPEITTTTSEPETTTTAPEATTTAPPVVTTAPGNGLGTTAPGQPGGTLPATGSTSDGAVPLAALLLAGGLGLAFVARRRTTA